MTELVINAPHLQTHSQRIGAVSLALFGWLLWCYFLFPLVTLGCWLMDNEECSQWVNMAGGYLNLKEMLLLYGYGVGVMVAAWSVWLIYAFLRGLGRKIPQSKPPVGPEDLCRAFGVEPAELAVCQSSQFAVVHYDDQGHIIGIEQG